MPQVSYICGWHIRVCRVYVLKSNIILQEWNVALQACLRQLPLIQLSVYSNVCLCVRVCVFCLFPAWGYRLSSRWGDWRQYHCITSKKCYLRCTVLPDSVGYTVYYLYINCLFIYVVQSQLRYSFSIVCVHVFRWRSWLWKCRCSERSWEVETRPLLNSHYSVSSYNRNISGNKRWVGVNWDWYEWKVWKSNCMMYGENIFKV